MLLVLIVLALTTTTTVSGLTCTSCEFKLLPPHSTNCNETCEGDVCFIVVNKYFNGTINAGCMYLHEGDKFEKDAVCQRTSFDNRCACNSGDRCNDPKVKLSTYTFTEEPVLADYQWLPQIQPEGPAIQPIVPSEIDASSNSTDSESSELINSLGKDMEGVIEPKTDKPMHAQSNMTTLANTSTPSTTSATIPMLHRNEELNEKEKVGDDDESAMTLSTRVAINVRENITSQQGPQIVETTSFRSPTIGSASIEVTRVMEEHGPRSAATMRPENANLAAESSDQDPSITTSDDSEHVNDSPRLTPILATCIALACLLRF